MIATSAAAAWPFPGPAYFKWVRKAPKLERAINDWAKDKRGEINPTDIFSMFVNNPYEHDWPPSNWIIGGLLTFIFGAAFETSQNALAWTIVLLAQHPKVVAALTEEIDGAVGGGLPSMDRIGTLPLLDGVIKEGMRLFPPVPLQFRRSLVEVELGGARIPAGMRILISAYLIDRDPELYEAPNKFKPERWRGLDRSPYQYPVFGSGGACARAPHSESQMVKIALAALLSSRRVELAPRARIDHRAAITLTPRPGVPIILRERATAPTRTSLSGSVHELGSISRTSAENARFALVGAANAVSCLPDFAAARKVAAGPSLHFDCATMSALAPMRSPPVSPPARRIGRLPIARIQDANERKMVPPGGLSARNRACDARQISEI